MKSKKDDNPDNATLNEVERLNGLLVRELTRKIVEGTATSTDLSTVQKLLTSAQVKPVDTKVHDFVQDRAQSQENFEWPVRFDDAN